MPRCYLGLLELEDDGAALEFGTADALGGVGEGDEAGGVDDRDGFDDFGGELDLTELPLFGCVGVVGEVAEVDLLLFELDLTPGAIDILDLFCVPFDEGLVEFDVVVELDAAGADELGDTPVVGGADGVDDVLEGAGFDGDCPPAAEAEAPPVPDPAAPPPPPA